MVSWISTATAKVWLWPLAAYEDEVVTAFRLVFFTFVGRFFAWLSFFCWRFGAEKSTPWKNPCWSCWVGKCVESKQRPGSLVDPKIRPRYGEFYTNFLKGLFEVLQLVQKTCPSMNLVGGFLQNTPFNTSQSVSPYEVMVKSWP